MTTDRRLVLLGLLAAASAAAFYAIVSVIVRHLVTTSAHPFVTLAFTSLLGSFLLVPVAARNWDHDRRAPRYAYGLAVLTGPLTLWGVGAFYTALQHAPVVIVNPLMATYPLLSITLARLFIRRREQFSLSTIAGAFLVVGGSVLVSIAAVR